MTRLARMIPLLGAFWGLAVSVAPAGELEDYVKRSDSAFAWSVESTASVDMGTITTIRLTSQVWQGITWTHNLTVYGAKDATQHPDAMLLFITGGSTGGQPKPADNLVGLSLSRLCGAPVAMLRQVPNQPLLDGKTEDDLISETFLRYLDTKDADWPLLLPMVKSAVAAMDALQAHGKEQGAVPSKFVVTGASKRGWTTWLVGATDDRIVGIAPMVIPTLNFRKQNPHQIKVWGKYSEQIDDYVRKGLMKLFETPDGDRLTRIVDPYYYLSKITVPKLLINGTNDRYWTLDSTNLFWDDIIGPKNVVFLPNAGHGLEQNRDYATGGIAALFRHAVTGRAMPEFEVSRTIQKDGSVKLMLQFLPEGRGNVKSVALWRARSEDLDFRESQWTCDLTGQIKPTTERYSIVIQNPDSGNLATFADLTCEIDGMPYHLSTLIEIQSAAKK
jgi:PhoPQ-activated pathogenicity-related protein